MWVKFVSGALSTLAFIPLFPGHFFSVFVLPGHLGKV